jgi:hypothetical protein
MQPRSIQRHNPRNMTMIRNLFRRLTVRPTFTAARTFNGTDVYSCRETGTRYYLQPVGGRILLGRDGELLATLDARAEAVLVIEADARATMIERRRLTGSAAAA